MNIAHFLRAEIAMLSLAVAVEARAQCTGDLNNDRQVNGADLSTLLANWGPRTSATLSVASDLDNDGQIDGADLGILLANWGPCPLVPWATIIEVQPDPSVVTDLALRAAIHATGLPWRVRDAGTGIEMLLVPPGTFRMGCIMGSVQYECHSWEQPVHWVTLTRPFYLGRYEVKQSEWTARMGSNPSYFRGYADSPDRPVEWVSWDDVQGFLSLTALRLPTEAEWEYACRAGTQTPFHNGSTDDSTVDGIAWYLANSSVATKPVGGKTPNGLGLYDVLGNAWEWVSDRYGDYVGDSQTDPTGPTIGTARVVRGGSVDNSTVNVRSSDRYGPAPTLVWYSVGFRVARNP